MRKPRGKRQPSILRGRDPTLGVDIGSFGGWADTEGPRGVDDFVAHEVPEFINRLLVGDPYDRELSTGDSDVPRNPDLWSEEDERCLMLYGCLDSVDPVRRVAWINAPASIFALRAQVRRKKKAPSALTRQRGLSSLMSGGEPGQGTSV